MKYSCMAWYFQGGTKGTTIVIERVQLVYDDHYHITIDTPSYLHSTMRQTYYSTFKCWTCCSIHISIGFFGEGAVEAIHGVWGVVFYICSCDLFDVQPSICFASKAYGLHEAKNDGHEALRNLSDA